MSDESFIEFTIDRISARDQIGSDLPEQLTRKRPTPIAVSFPHDDGLEALGAAASLSVCFTPDCYGEFLAGAGKLSIRPFTAYR